MPLRRALVCLLCLASLALPASAVTLRVCVDQMVHLPIMTPDLGGTVGMLVKMAAAEVGVELAVAPAPLGRCVENLKAGHVDAFPYAPYLPDSLPFLGYPVAKNGEVDPARAVAVLRNRVFRLKSGKVQWDGQRFSGQSMPVLATFGAVLVVDKLKAMKVNFDDNGKSTEANLRKLMAGRGDLVIAMETDGKRLLSQAEFGKAIEMLPASFSEAPYFLGISQRFIAKNPGLAEALWRAIGQIRQSPAYAVMEQQLIAEAAKAAKE